jgi:hypothetical protein
LRRPARQPRAGPGGTLRTSIHKETDMPIILWLLGVPIVVIVLLMLFGVL